MITTLLTLLITLVGGTSSPAADRPGPAVLQLGPVPPGWCVARHDSKPDHAARAQSLSVVDPSGSANLIATSERINTRIESRAYARAQGELLARDLTGYREMSAAPAPLLGRRDAFVREFSWQPDGDGERVRQLQGYVAQSGTGYVVTVTASSSAFAAQEAMYRELLQSVKLRSSDDAAEIPHARCRESGVDSSTT